jgi:hypothetical protein
LPAAPPINEKAATRKGAGFHSDPNSMSLFLDAVHSIASFSLAGFDLQTVFLGRSGQEARTLCASQPVVFRISPSVAP